MVDLKIEWKEPWKAIDDDGSRFVKELRKEITAKHPLYQKNIISIAYRIDNSDVLFFAEGLQNPFVVVNLTWSGSEEENSALPWTVFYKNIESFVRECIDPHCADIELPSSVETDTQS